MTKKRIEIAIPSYKRAETLRDKTMALLAGLDVDPKGITIFVANADEKKIYSHTLDPKSYGKIVVGEVGMGAIRRFIQQYYKEGQCVLNMDDDLKNLIVRDGAKTKHKITGPEFHQLVAHGFAACDESGARLWGIYPVNNQFFMQDTVTYDLRYVIGSFWGVVNSRDKKRAVTLDDKEDFERTMRFYLLDKAVVRMNYVGTESNYYGEEGGMQVERTLDRIEGSAKLMNKRYPRLCTAFLKKGSEHWELRLKDTRGVVKARPKKARPDTGKIEPRPKTVKKKTSRPTRKESREQAKKQPLASGRAKKKPKKKSR